jgi:hypothetical protein
VTCRALKGPNLAHSNVIKIVRRYGRQRGRSRLLSCVRPAGPVYNAGTSGRDGARGKAMDPFEPWAGVLSADGQLAGAFGDSVTTVVKVFDPAGAARVLDAGPFSDIPASSVALSGSTLIWAHAGRAMSVEL